MPITGRILATATAHPDRIAIAGADQQLTYRELVTFSGATAAAAAELHQTGTVTPAPETGGVPITALSITSAFHTARIIAALAGFRAVSATIDPRWPLADQVGIIITAGIAVVISDSAALAAALRDTDWGGRVISLADFCALEKSLMTSPGAMPVPQVRDADEVFLMLFSSGTTQRPKAFVKTRAQYRTNFALSSPYLDPLPGVMTLAPGPVSYSLTLYAVIEALASGGSIAVADQIDPIQLGQRIAQLQATRIVAVPAVAQGLATAAGRNPERFTSVNLVVLGGANLSAAMRSHIEASFPAALVISYYGTAEIGFIGDSRSGDGTAITLYDGIAGQVRSEEGIVLPEGQMGTLWIKSPARSDGYVSATTDAILLDEEGWASVNDQAELSGNVIYLAGRAGDIAITGGHKVSLVQVENAFDSYPGISAACAIAVPHDRLGSVIGLVIEVSPRGTAALPPRQELQSFARAHLAPQYVPRRWFAVSQLPRTVGGKVRRGVITDRIRERQPRTYTTAAKIHDALVSDRPVRL